jgi:hypothetical protein
MKKMLGIFICWVFLVLVSQVASAQEATTGEADGAGSPIGYPFDYPYVGRKGPGMGYDYQQATPGSVRGLGYPYADQGPYPYRGRGAGYGPGGRGYGYGYPGYRGRGGTGYPGHRQYGNPPFYRANEAATD